jgi:hypothetical protein
MTDEFVTITTKTGLKTVVDPEDADLSEYIWKTWKGSTGRHYVERLFSFESRTITVLMHRVILARKLGRHLVPGEVVDHINLDSLDNRRVNLRPSTIRTNQYNQGLHKNNKSGYKGVCYIERENKWRAQIQYMRKVYYLGSYDTPEEAHKVYCEAAVKYHGEFARFA